MKTHEEFLKAIAIVKEYQLQVENDYRNKQKDFLKIELTVYNPSTKLGNMDMSLRMRNMFKRLDFSNERTIYKVSLYPENEFFKVRGFGKELKKELKKLKHLSGIICS